MAARFIPTPPPNFEPETRTGGCLCGAVRFEYHGVPIERVHVLSCDCNLCTVLGPLNYYTKPESIRFTKGSWDALKVHKHYSEYYEHEIAYNFCDKCGSVFGGEHPGVVMINSRLFDDIDVNKLPIKKFHARGRTAKMDAADAEAASAKTRSAHAAETETGI